MHTRYLFAVLLLAGPAWAQTPPPGGALGRAPTDRPPPPGLTADQACMGKAGGTPVQISDPNGQSRQVICGQQPMTGPQNPRMPMPHPAPREPGMTQPPTPPPPGSPPPLSPPTANDPVR